MIQIEPFSDLVFVYAVGCDACEEAQPELDKFAAAYPRMMIVKIQAGGPFVDRLLGRIKIKATPTYVFRLGGEGFSHEGMMTSKELATWIDTIMAREEGDDE